MSHSNSALFGIHAQALGLWRRRMEVLASNLANADTPNYKARDIDFRRALADSATPRVPLAASEPGHIGEPQADARLARLMYRIPMQPSTDGNTVDADIAKSAFAQNTVHYRASLAFINNRIRELKLAIRGQ
jgi:flagellar basal-body rod protein FlgB